MLLALVTLVVGFAIGYLVAGHNYKKAHADSLQFHEYWDDFLAWVKDHRGEE